MRGHPAQVPRDGGPQAVGAPSARVAATVRRDAAARGVDALVVGTLRAQVELVGPVAAEGGMGVAVDQARDRDPAAAVDRLEVAVRRARTSLGVPDRRDPAVDDGDRRRRDGQSPGRGRRRAAARPSPRATRRPPGSSSRKARPARQARPYAGIIPPESGADSSPQSHSIDRGELGAGRPPGGVGVGVVGPVAGRVHDLHDEGVGADALPCAPRRRPPASGRVSAVFATM